ncbi:MAG: peptidase C45 [Candidatus Hydrogenedentes bacterium]|nr:peptidase C45 [Candidatus Hydrogenedentota bacterium]
MKSWMRVFALAPLFAVLLLGCGEDSGSGPVEPTPARDAAASLPVSETAMRTEIKLPERAPASEMPLSLPPDHWLVGTSDVADMYPATIAPPAPRQLLAEYGPAYIEQIGENRVLHLKGSHYDMGYQHGTLVKDEIVEAAALIRAIGSIEWNKDFDASIQEAWTRLSPYIPEKYKEEMKGVADATGMTLEQVQEFTIFPELFHCSGFALWGKATQDGSLLHGRVLDYMRDAGLDKWALLIIQEPEGANAFVNVAYSGMLGSVTGMNAEQIAIGEMGGGGAEKWDGMPMSLLLRECLEEADTLEDAQRIMSETPRTCQYYYVISDAKANGGLGHAVGVAAEPGGIVFIGPNEFHDQLPRPFEDAVLLSAGGRYTCLADRVEKMYGQFTPQIALDLMARGVSMKSNMHNALFKPRTLELWVSNSTVEQPSCNRLYAHYSFRSLLNTRP